MPNDWNLGIQLQPVTVQVDGVPHEMLYGATEPEYVGIMPLRTDLETLPLPPDRDSQDALSFASDLSVSADSYDINLLEVRNQSAPPFELNPNGGVLQINGEYLNDISFYSKDRVEVLRITESGDFLVQGRLVKNDMDVYNAFRAFLGLSMGIPPTHRTRDGIPTRYERILKKPTEDQ